MDDNRSSEQKPREVTRDDFVRDSSDAVRHAKEHGSVLITETDGRPYALLSVSREPLDFGWE